GGDSAARGEDGDRGEVLRGVLEGEKPAAPQGYGRRRACKESGRGPGESLDLRGGLHPYAMTTGASPCIRSVRAAAFRSPTGSAAAGTYRRLESALGAASRRWLPSTPRPASGRSPQT